jgi:hypothetical protein
MTAGNSKANSGSLPVRQKKCSRFVTKDEGRKLMPFCIPRFLKQMHLRIRTIYIGLILFVDIRKTRLNETTKWRSSIHSTTVEI